MRKISNVLLVFTLIMCIIVIPLGISNVCLAYQLGLIFEMFSSLFMLALFIAFTGYELREFMMEVYYDELETTEQAAISDDVPPGSEV